MNMQRGIITLVTIILSLNTYSQSVFDDETFYKFEGINYLPEVKVNKGNESILYTLYDKTNRIVVSESFSYTSLPLERYLSFYNSIGLLSNEKGDFYLYDFITKKKLPYSGEYNKYNEGIGLGKYNPILQKNILRIIDENLNQLRKIVLEVTPNSKQYWILLAEGTDVMTGKVILLKGVKLGATSAEYIYYTYEYDVLTNKIKRIK